MITKSFLQFTYVLPISCEFECPMSNVQYPANFTVLYYDSPVIKLVPYKDTGCVWILGIGYFLPACSVAIMPPVLWPTRAIENTITKVLSEKCIQKC